MQCGQEFSFQDLKCKLVINVLDGKILGNIIDIIFFPQTGKILGFVVPGEKRGWFKPCETIFIPYSCVCKVGIDCILVRLCVDSKQAKDKFNNFIGILDDNQAKQNSNLKNNSNEVIDLENNLSNETNQFEGQYKNYYDKIDY